MNVPLMVGYRFIDVTNDPIVNPRIFAGPSAQFLTKTEWSEGEYDEQVNWKEYTWAAVLGAGVDIDIFFIDFGYSWGLSNVAGRSGGSISRLPREYFLRQCRYSPATRRLTQIEI